MKFTLTGSFPRTTSMSKVLDVLSDSNVARIDIKNDLVEGQPVDGWKTFEPGELVHLSVAWSDEDG